MEENSKITKKVNTFTIPCEFYDTREDKTYILQLCQEDSERLKTGKKNIILKKL